MSNASEGPYEVAGGEIVVWGDVSGAIFLKVRSQPGDPVELGMDEAKVLAEVLLRLADD